MKRTAGIGLLVLAGLLALAGAVLSTLSAPGSTGLPNSILWKLVVALGIVAAGYGLYLLASRAIVATAPTKARAHSLLTILRLAIFVAVALAVLGLLTQRWLGLMVSLGVVGFAITFALQQPLASLIGWAYIVVKQPYRVGDRVRIDDAKGDVIDVDFLVTTLWEVGGELVSGNQPSGRLVTVPNSTVLSTQVYNFSWDDFPYVWNELTLQVAYETDLEFARSVMVEEADDLLGDEMAERIAQYREVLDETPVELEVRERPSVNVVQEQSWVELRLRYLVHPKKSQSVRNQLYERILERCNEAPDRVAFPVSRNR
ncbi:mechanosensitive ion channel family protein [Salinarchaeum chitinilyticum]